jgi:DNA-directed RNA polymerase III subunit RPC1
MVKKCGVLKILHDKFKSVKKNEAIVKEMVESFCIAKEFNKEIEPLIPKAHEILNPLQVLFLFKNIPSDVYTNPSLPSFYSINTICLL